MSWHPASFERLLTCCVLFSSLNVFKVNGQITDVDCFAGLGFEYVGKVSKTKSGKSCVNWGDMKEPRRTKYKESNFYENDYERSKNYCRNPNVFDSGRPAHYDKSPWCYTTTGPPFSYGYCEIEKCAPEVDCYQKETNGYYYVGKLSKTRRGTSCVNWKSKLQYGESTFFEESFNTSKNYCRNPKFGTITNRAIFSRKLWCFVQRYCLFCHWDYCDVPICKKVDAAWTSWKGWSTCLDDVITRRRQCSGAKYGGTTSCPGRSTETRPCPEVECYQKSTKGYYYVGTLSKTRYGTRCVNWKDAKHYRENYFFEKSFDAVKNYCRNPKSPYDNISIVENKPWCYIPDPKAYYSSVYAVWDYCDVPICKKGLQVKTLNQKETDERAKSAFRPPRSASEPSAMKKPNVKILRTIAALGIPVILLLLLS